MTMKTRVVVRRCQLRRTAARAERWRAVFVSLPPGRALLEKGLRNSPKHVEHHSTFYTITVEESGDASAGHGGAAAPGSAPEDWRTRGILATVDPDDTDEILRLRGLVDPRLHGAARAQDVEAICELLAAGASPAALDWEGRTPLHLCVAHRLIEPLKALLKAPGGANVRDASNLSLLHVALLHGWPDGACAALDAGASVGSDFKNAMFTMLPIEIAMESGDMKMFEMVLNAAERDGMLDTLNGSRKTALFTAIEKSNIPAIQAILRRGAILQIISDNEKTTVLHAAVHDHNILKYLLDNTNIARSMAKTKDGRGQIPLHAAVAANNPESVRLLVDNFNNTRVIDDFHATPLHYAAYRSRYEAAEILLEKDLGTMDEIDKEGNTPLLAAVKYNSRRVTLLLLQKGGQLSAKNRNGVTVLELISRNFYEASKYFELILDMFIHKTNDDNDIMITIDYRVLTSGQEMSQMNVLEEFMNCDRSVVLIHPMIEILLYLKWKHFLPIFYALVSVYVIFLVTVNVFVICVFYKEGNEIRNSTFMPGPEFCGGAEAYWVLVILICGTISILLLQEVFFMHVKRLRYFASAESWVKLCGLALCAATPPLAALAPGPWPRHAACAALLLAWLQAIFLVSRLPSWGYYVLMFGKVALDMLKILVTVIFLVIGFAICFMIQFRWAPPFDGLFAAFVKTLVMMSTEYNYEGLFGEDHEEHLEDAKTGVRMLFVIFMVFMAIVLMNFMTGVAVDDISDLNKVGNIRRVEKQVELLSCLDYLVYDGVLSKWLQKIFGDERYTKYMKSYRRYLSTWDRFYQNDTHCTVTINSSRLRNEIMNVVCRNDYRDEVKQDKIAKKSRKCKLDAVYEAIVGSSIINEKGKRAERKENDSVTIKEQISKISNDLSDVTRDIGELRRVIEDLKTNISAVQK